MSERIKGTRVIDRCYDCEHCKGKWFNDTFESPYGTESTGHGYSYCELDEDLEISGLDIPKHCPIYGTEKKPKTKKPDCIEGMDASLEILKLPSVHCPINGWQLVSICETTGSYVHKECPFYKGKKTLTDLVGEKFETVQCTVELYRNKEYRSKS
jgi:hypothetical protein